MHKLAIVAIAVLGCLQFLPAMHFDGSSNPMVGIARRTLLHLSHSLFMCFVVPHFIAFLDLELLKLFALSINFSMFDL